MEHFSGFGLSEALNASLQKMGYKTPTPIQAQAIPLALEGRDILGSAQTGTGKTAAFAIPLIEKLLTNPRGSALVLTPTRELGKQIMDIMKQLTGGSGAIKTAFIIGGEPMGKQMTQLRARPRLIVGTPGRIMDHLERGNLMLHDTKFLVLDETDRMLDMGFSIQLEKIFKFLPAQRQTLMFSATLPDNILKLSKKYLNNPERVAIGGTEKPAENIEQKVIKLVEEEKYGTLVGELQTREGSIIIFVKTKIGADRLAKKLKNKGFEAEAIHGDMSQGSREKVIRHYRAQRFRILVATDVVARGLDVPHIEHVINYDLPQAPEDYIHRIGRTARAGAEGQALCLIAPQDNRKWAAIEAMMFPGEKKAPKQRSGNSRRRSGGGGNRNNRSGKEGGSGKNSSGRNRFRGPKPEGKGGDNRKSKSGGRPNKDGKPRGPKKDGAQSKSDKPKSFRPNRHKKKSGPKKSD